MARCIAEPLSRKDIRKTAELIRKIDGSENDMFFDIVRFLEIKLPSIDSNFNFRVLPQDEMGECHGITYPDRNEIQIRQQVKPRKSRTDIYTFLVIPSRTNHIFHTFRPTRSLKICI